MAFTSSSGSRRTCPRRATRQRRGTCHPGDGWVGGRGVCGVVKGVWGGASATSGCARRARGCGGGGAAIYPRCASDKCLDFAMDAAPGPPGCHSDSSSLCHQVLPGRGEGAALGGGRGAAYLRGQRGGGAGGAGRER